MVWDNIDFTNGTMTINSPLVINVLTVASGFHCTFAGTDGFTTNDYVCTSANRVVTFQAGINYYINNDMTVTGNVSQPVYILSSSAMSYSNIILDPAATQSVSYTNTTDIDSSAGQTIYAIPSVLVRTINWKNSKGGGNFFKMF